MRRLVRKTVVTFLGLGLLGMVGGAEALTWELNRDGSYVYGTGITATVTGWAEATPTRNDPLVNVSDHISNYSSNPTGNYIGIDIDNVYGDGQSNEYPPNHAIDNDGRREMLMFEFNEGGSNVGIALQDLNLGWAHEGDYSGSANGHADLTVLAWNPTDPTADAPTVENKRISPALLDEGWTIVGHYNDVGTGGYTFNTGNGGVSGTGPDAHSKVITSSHWIVAAYLKDIGGNPYGADNCGDSSDNLYYSCGGANHFDYFKLASVSGDKTTPPSPPTTINVPAPGTLLLLGLGLPLIRQARKKIAH